MDEFKYKIALGLWQGLTMDKQRVKFLRDHYNTNHKLLNKLMYDYLFSLKDPSIHADYIRAIIIAKYKSFHNSTWR